MIYTISKSDLYTLTCTPPQTLLLHRESSPDLFESVQPPKLAAHAATWVSDGHQGWIYSDFA